MFTISTLAAVFWGLLIAAIGFFIGNYLLKKDASDWKSKYKELEGEVKSLRKTEKKALKDMGKFKGQADNWRQKFDEMKDANRGELEAVQAENTELTNEISSLKSENAKLESSQNSLTSENERISKKYDNLKDRYDNDLEGLKEFKKDKSKFDSYLKDYKSKLKVSEEKLAKLSVLSKKQAAELVDANEFVSKVRGLKARNKQLESDLKYWEKKHYDTHHELTSLKNEYTQFQEKHAQLELTMQSVNQANQSMVQKVQEFKTRFVKVNNDYHNLLNKN